MDNNFIVAILIFANMKKVIWKVSFVLLFLSFFLSGCQKVISGTGYVVDKSTLQPIQGALVEAYLGNPSPDALQMSTQTNAQGAYYVYTQPYTYSGTYPTLYVNISMKGYQGAYVRNPHNDTTYLVKLANR